MQDPDSLPGDWAASGLSKLEAAERLRTEGPNEIPSARPRTTLRIALQVLQEPMLLLLVVTGVVYLLLGSPGEALTLIGAIAVVIGITIYQTRKTERTLDALKDLASPRALVIRGGEKVRIAGREVVRQDVLLLSEGDRVPADALLFSSINLTVDESLLTGESMPVRKGIWNGQSGMIRPGGEDSPALFAGTLVVQGSGTARVMKTGVYTEIGKLGRSLQQIQVEGTRLERETHLFVRQFAIASAALCVVVAVFYGLGRHQWLQGALAGLALAISLVPEEFPVVLTVFFAIGAWRISKKQVLTRRVSVIETLGSASVLCVDKTGTLTMNRMSVRKVVSEEGHNDAEVIMSAVFASSAQPVDPMEQALVVRAAELEIVRASPSLIREYPLSRSLLMMSRVVEIEGQDQYSLFAKGAPEAILQVCRLSPGRSSPILSLAETMAGTGLRVLGVSTGKCRKGELPESQWDFEHEFLGLIGFEDPVRPSVPSAIAECASAGIRVIMITGDYPATARNIAAQIGLPGSDETITGQQIEEMTDAELLRRVSDAHVFARILPEQKLRLVNALKANGEVVAMSGDGVNDAPALKSADIGIAMGGRGTDVAREAASLVLLNDDFSSIVEAVRLGRRIYENLRKAMTYIFAVHVPIAGMSLVPVLFRMPLVLMPLHIVFLELIIDPACSIAFESEPGNPAIMSRPPRNPKDRMFDGKMIATSMYQGLGLFVVSLGAFFVSLHRGQGERDARAITFTTMVIGNIMLIWSNRSQTRTILETLRAPNKPLWMVTAGALLLLAIVLYVPGLRDLFQFSTLHVRDLFVCVLLGMASVTWFEITKLRHRAPRAQ